MVNHIDDSRERPERGVSDTIREKGGYTDSPENKGAHGVAGGAAAKAAAANKQNSSSNADEDDDKKDDDRDTRHNKLKSAIERTEDAADAER